jgi:hypothetical protein
LTKRECAKNGEIQFEQLTDSSELSSDELEDIAKLIYSTDEYIYPDMFGSETIATAVLPKVLQAGSDPMFHKKNLFICRAGNRVVGIILWIKGSLNWNKGNLENEIIKYVDFDQKKPLDKNKILENLEAVSKTYLEDKYSSANDGITLLNVCVDPDVRGMRVATLMLQEGYCFP